MFVFVYGKKLTKFQIIPKRGFSYYSGGSRFPDSEYDYQQQLIDIISCLQLNSYDFFI